MRRAYCVAGLGFGDEGKGSITDALVRTTGATLVVRYNGGPQCAHNVVTADGRHHVFAQLGSGSFVDGCDTYLSRFMLIEPFALRNEYEDLQGKIRHQPKVWVEAGSLVITPFHWMVNRCLESSRGAERHGSCGFGVGECRRANLEGEVSITAGELPHPRVLREKLEAVRAAALRQVNECEPCRSQVVAEDLNAVVKTYSEVADSLLTVVPNGSLAERRDEVVVFEGAQGVLLDETHGFAPHTTWTDTTFRNAETLLTSASGDVDITRIGVLRTYGTRHGAGPFPTEDATLSYADHNRAGPWQGRFRFGHFDAVLARYAVRIAGPSVDWLAMTHLDQQSELVYANAYTVGGGRLESLDTAGSSVDTEMLFRARPEALVREPYSAKAIERLVGVPVGIESWGETAEAKQWVWGQAGS